jgi:hypothetical protein
MQAYIFLSGQSSFEEQRGSTPQVQQRHHPSLNIGEIE